MTTNNFNEKGYYTEEVSKLLELKPENMEFYMADDLVKEWERIRSIRLNLPELDFGEDRGINDIPKDNVLLKLNTPKGGLVIKFFEGEDDKEDSWELRVIINHPAKARIMSNISETFEKWFPTIYKKWSKNLITLFLKKNNIENEFNDIYDLFYAIAQYRTFLYKKYTSNLLKIFDCDEIFFNKDNRGILARRYSNGRKEIILEGLMTTVPETDIPIYKLRTYDNNLYKYFDDNHWKKFASLADAATYLLAFNKNYKEISEDKNKIDYILDIQNALMILVDGLKKPSLSSVFSESYFKDYTKIENKLLEIVNEIYQKCDPSSISTNSVNEYLNNCSKIRYNIERLLNSVVSNIKGLLFDADLHGTVNFMVCHLKNENKFDIESLEKNCLNIFDSRTNFGKMRRCYLHIEDSQPQENKNIEIIVNFAFSLFYLYNNLTLNMDYDIHNGMVMRLKKGDTKDKYTLLRKLDEIMNNKLNLMSRFKEEEKESTVGNY